MKQSRVVMVVGVFLITTGLLLVLLFSPFAHLGRSMQAAMFASSQSVDLSTTLIAKENAQLGTKKWQYNLDKGTSIYIQAYADAVSIQPAQKLTFFVSTHDEGTRYAISFYRLGWYSGDGARLLSSTNFLPGHAQGYYDGVRHTLINCHACQVNTTTGQVEANWQPSYVLNVPAEWTTGLYLAEFTDEYNYTAVVPFDVRGNTHAKYLLVTPDSNYQAYNNWGGYSLFTANTNAVQHSVKVSFDRPYMFGQDTSQIFDAELNAIRWFESQGYDLSYISSVDLHEHPSQLLDHRALIFLGQNTFWTKEMRDGVEYARDHGVGLAFLGADNGTWQMRFETDYAGNADRMLVSYRVSSASHNLQFDPLYGKDNTRVTAQWRDPLLGRPENALLGVMFSGATPRPTNFTWRTSSHLNLPLLASTGLLSNQSYGCGLVGNLWDRVFNNGAIPPGLSVLASSKTLGADNQPDVSNTTVYTAPSGALVFASGSLYWSRGLDGYRFHQDPQCPAHEDAVPEIQHLMTNVMSALVVPHKLASVSHMLPLITTPRAFNAPQEESQGYTPGIRSAPLPGNMPASPVPSSHPQKAANSLEQQQIFNEEQERAARRKASSNSFHSGRRGLPIGDAVMPSSPMFTMQPKAPYFKYMYHYKHHFWSNLFSRILHDFKRKGWLY